MVSDPVESDVESSDPVETIDSIYIMHIWKELLFTEFRIL